MTLPDQLTHIFKIKQKSYKMHLVLAMLDEIHNSGHPEVPLAAVASRFLKQLQQREAAGLPVDQPPAKLGSRWSQIHAGQIHSLLQTPIQALSSVLHYDASKQTMQFNQELQSKWSDSVEQELRDYAMEQIDEYYSKLHDTGIPLREHLLKIMTEYLSAKQESFSNHSLGHFVRRTIPEELEKLPFMSDQFKIQGSVGMGNWATIPWIAIMDRQITETTQHGEYIVYLFSEDMESVYLTLNQGVTVPLKDRGRKEGYAYLQQKVTELREQLPLEGMQKDDNIQLTDSGLGRDYQVSTVAYYRYSRDQLPSNEKLIEDLRNVVENYQLYADSLKPSAEAQEEASFKYTIAHLYAGQGILHFLRGRPIFNASIDELAANQATVLLSGDGVKHPKERVRHIGRALGELGLLMIANHQLTLTEFGRQYADAFDPNIWRVSDMQAKLLRQRIEHHQPATALQLIIRQAITICEQLQTFTVDAFQIPFIDALHMQEEWGEVTQRNRAVFMLNWLEELGYIAKSGGEQYRFIKAEENALVDTLPVPERINAIKAYIRHRGFAYPDPLIENFYLSLKTKPFAILAGVSGTGKTKLVKLFAEALGANSGNRQFTLIPVRPDWSDPSDLIGYKDLSGHFRPGPLTEVLAEAVKPVNRHKPYFVCLDEMNLARVEHYFSDVLSVLETQERRGDRVVTDPLIKVESLVSEEDRQQYGNLYLPDNVYLIGTVNMDETTHPFSKKVLDRANTIEFNYIDLDQFPSLGAPDEPTVPAANAFLRCEYLQLVDVYQDYQDEIQGWTSQLVEINTILEEIHSHVGFRIRDALCFYMIHNERYQLMSRDQAFDLQLLQKLLPRIQGSNSSVKRVLLQLMQIALGQKLNIAELLEDASPLYSGQVKPMAEGKYPHSARKIVFMLRRLEEDGFTSYWLS